MGVITTEILAGGRKLRLTGAHPSYLDAIAKQRQWGTTPLMRMIRTLPRGATYLDVGANIGLTAITAASTRPDLRVVAFEPVRSNAELLARNIAENRLENCAVVNSAVGDKPGEVAMNNNGPWSTIESSAGGHVDIPIVTLDDYCAAYLPDTRVDLIKIDVEGYEPNVLAGASTTIARWNPTIFMEFNSWALIRQGRNPLAFAAALWQAFHVESDAGEVLENPIVFAHANMVSRGCVEDIVLRARPAVTMQSIDVEDIAIPPEALTSFASVVADDEFVNVGALRMEIDALRNSTSWRVTAPLRSVKSMLTR